MTASVESERMARRLRVMMVTGEYPPDQGGVADYTRCLSEALAERNVSVDVLTTRRRAKSEPSVRAAADGVAEHPVVRDWSWGALRAMSRAARVLQPDIVHIQYQAAAFGMGPAIHLAPQWLRWQARWSGRPRLGGRAPGRRRGPCAVVTFHDLRVPYLFPKAGRLRSDAVRLLAGRADLAIVTNAQDADELGRRLPDSRLALVPIGSNLPDQPPAGYDRAAWRGANGLPADAPVLAYFGFLNESKGARTLAGALQRLTDAGRDARLVMIGGRVGASDPTNAAYLDGFEADLERRGLGDRVVWTGHVSPSEVSAWFHAADVAVLPYLDGASYRRGSLLAALTHAVPVVTTWPDAALEGTAGARDSGAAQPSGSVDTAPGPASGSTETPGLAAPPELDDRLTAMLVRPDDEAALAAAVAEVLDDASLSETLSRSARELSGAFTWNGIAARHVELYRELVAAEVST